MRQMLKCLAIAIAVSLTGQCQALEVLADNLANLRSGGQSINDLSWPAQAFTTTATGYIIDSITLNMSRDGEATGSIDLIIYDSSGLNGRPGNTASAVFETIDVASQLSTIASPITFSNLNVTLDPTTTYYLVLRGRDISISGHDALWSYTNNTVGTGFPSNYSESNDSGVTWDIPVTSSPQKMSITAVPEPSTLLLAGLSFVTVFVTSRRHLRK